MRLEKWALIRRTTNESTGGLVLPQDYEKVKSHGLGDSYGRERMEDGSTITTSKVVELSETKLITRSGSEYELGEMHPDYLSFIEACQKGIPVLKDWEFSHGVLYGRLFNNGNYESEELFDKAAISGKVIKQDIENNLCTLQTSHGEMSVYVDWHAISENMLMDFQLFLTKEQVESMLHYANKRIKPDILGIHKKMLERF